jgi:hypothetical protein
MASAQNISVEVNAELAALVAKLDAKLKQTEKALDICFNRLSIMDRMAAQAEFKEWLDAAGVSSLMTVGGSDGEG